MMCYAYNYEATKQNDMGRQLSRGYGVLYQTRTENRAESEERTFMVLHRVCYIGSLGHTLLSMLYILPLQQEKKESGLYNTGKDRVIADKEESEYQCSQGRI